VNAAALLGSGLAFSALGIALVMAVPDRAQLVVLIESAGANQVVVPVGLWIAVGLWLASVKYLAPSLDLRSLARGASAAIMLHVLCLLAQFASRLQDPPAFSHPAYWYYTRLFCAAVLAAATWWSFASVRTWRMPAVQPALLDAPVVVGTVVFAVALARYDSPLSVAGLAAGVLAAMASQRAMVVMLVRTCLRAVHRDERLFVAAVFLLALGLRLLYLQRILSDPGFLETGADGPVYDELAWSLAQGRDIRASFTDRFPLLLLGYVWWVSVVYRIVGHSYFLLCATQALIGSVACVLLYGVARRLFGILVARLAMVFTAISFPLLFAAAAIGHQAIDVCLTLFVIWLTLRALDLERPSLWHWAGIGLALGAAIAVRETVVFLLAFIVAWLPWAFAQRRWRAAGGAIAATLLGVAVMVGPLAVPKVATSENRTALRAHLDRLYRGEFDINPLRTGLVGPVADPIRAGRQLFADPLLVIGTLVRAYARNLGLQFFTQPYGGFDLVFLLKGTEYFYGLWFYVYAATVGGAVLAWRRIRAGDPSSAGLVLVAGVIAARTLPHLVLESNARHRAPIEPFLILLAASGVVGLVVTAWRPAARV